MARKSWVFLPLAALAIPLVHCADAGQDMDSAAGPGGSAGACFGTSCGGGAMGGGTATGGHAGLPPEQEVESSFESPVATGRFVWAANPDSGRVALVDAKKVEVRTAEAGFGPTYLAAVPRAGQADADQAIVINVKSRDATFFRVEADGKLTAQTVPIHAGANSWAVSAGGRWAMAWTDATKLASPDPTEGLQDITVIDLAGSAPVATRLSVGYRPTRMFFSSDELRAFAVTEPGVTVIELEAGPFVAKDVAVTDNPLENPASRDVSITPNGEHALIRREGSPDVGVVSLETGDRVTVRLSGPVTGARAIVVVRTPDLPAVAEPDAGALVEDAGPELGEAGDAADDGPAPEAAAADAAPPAPPPSSEVFLLPIPGIVSSPESYDQITIDGEIVGSVSVSEKGDVALLYTNAMPNDHLTILRTEAGAGYLGYRTVALKAPVVAVFPASDSAHAVALLAPGAGSNKPGAFSVVPIAKDLPPKIQGTDAKPFSVTIAAAPSSRALVTVRDDLSKLYAAYVARMPELQVDKIVLSSPPLASGMVPSAGVAWVAQKHPEGRITFVDLTSGSARTLTGFELGAKVVDGTQ
jgi:hypothetical protein